MAAALKANTSSFLNLNNTTNQSYLFRPKYTKHSVVSIVSSKSYKPLMATLSTAVGNNTVGLSETFTRLKQQGKVSIYILFYLFLFVFMYKVTLVCVLDCIDCLGFCLPCNCVYRALV